MTVEHVRVGMRVRVVDNKNLEGIVESFERTGYPWVKVRIAEGWFLDISVQNLEAV